MPAHVYMMANKKNGTIYLGVTTNLRDRVYKHKEKIYEGFTQKYDVTNLVWAEEFCDVRDAIVREKQIKKWNRQWKINLIVANNPEWNDLYETV